MIESLKLIPTTSDDADLLFPLFSNAEVIKFTNFRHITDKNELVSFLDRFLVINKDEPLQYGPYNIALDDKIIGICGLQQIDLSAGTAELWYVLMKEYWGKGFAKKAIQLLLHLTKDNDLLKSIYAEAVQSNQASWHILENFGFQKIGSKILGFQKDMIKEDLLLYSLLR